MNKDKLIELLKEHASFNSEEALREIEAYVAKNITEAVQYKTNTDIGEAPTEPQNEEEIGISADFFIKHARMGNVEVLYESMQLLVDGLVDKIIELSTPETYISHIGIYADRNMHRQRRMGFYGTVELQNIKPQPQER